MTYSTAAPRLGVSKIAIASLVLVGLLAFAGRASATTFRPTDGPSLQTAVASANSNPGPDTIFLAPGVYQPKATMTITDNLTITASPSQQAPPLARVDGSFVAPLQSDMFIVAAGKTLTLNNHLVTNAADPTFAAIRVEGTLLANNAAIAGNNGFNVAVSDGGRAIINNSTLSDGTDRSILIAPTAVVKLNNSTVANNTGGGIENNGQLDLYNTVVSRNDPLGFTFTDCVFPATSSIASVDSDGTCGANRTIADPLLGPTNNQGGPTPTMALRPGSPLIDTGDNANCPTVDQRYFVRSDGRCDIGAYEAGAVRDTTPPTCAVSALRDGPPKQQDVTAQDTGSGLDADAVSNLTITNGTVAFTPFTQASRSPLVLTATKTTAGTPTRWSFTLTDVAGNVKDCR